MKDALKLSVWLLVLVLGCLYRQVGSQGPRNWHRMLVRLNNGDSNQPGPNIKEGRVEVSWNRGRTWGTICSTNWSMREGNVVCRQLGLGYAAAVAQSTQFGNSRRYPWSLRGTMCRGTEKKLSDCYRKKSNRHGCDSTSENVATVRCTMESADLKLGTKEIEQSARLDLVPMSRIKCAMEENCVSRDAYEIRRTQPHALRYLLRFTTRAENVGTADFSPYANYREWEWHQCHRHFHSMKVFATFHIYNLNYQKVAEGHKASFCLMDSSCVSGIRPKYTCGNTTQGISIGCADTYGAGLDCQWVDVTNLARNRSYILRVAINPEYRIGEISFENNGVECRLHYTGRPSTTRVTRCVHSSLWFKKLRSD